MKHFTMLVLLAAFAIPAAQAAVKKPSKSMKTEEAPLPAKIPAGLKFFQPKHRLSGIGLDRKGMSDLVLQARTKLKIEAETFPIMRDPRVVGWAEAITSAKLQEIFERAGKDSGFPKETLEAVAFVESGGDPNAQSPTGPKGIMQFTQKTGELAGLKQIYETRYKLEPQRKLIKKATKGHPAVYKNLPPKKVPYKALVEDERLNPQKAIPAAARLLASLARQYGSPDFGVWAYHSGEGPVNKALAQARKQHIKDPTMAKIFFGNCPGWRDELFELIQKDMDKDYGPTYYFRIKRAEELLAMYRTNKQEYVALAKRYANPVKPDERAPNRLWVWFSPKDMYQTTDELEAARGKQLLVGVPDQPAFFSYSLRTSGLEAIGEKEPKRRELFLQDPPEDVGALLYVAFETRRLWEATHPKKEKFFLPPDITGLIRSLEYQELLKKTNPNARTPYPTHAFGAVDVSYLRLPPWEEKCLKFVIQDMGWDEYLSYFRESIARKTLHFAPSPSHREFFLEVYQEAQQALPKKR